MEHISNILKSRIGQRMFRVYALSTIIPILLLIFISYFYFIDNFEDESKTQLLRNQQQVSRLVQERIGHLASQYKILTNHLNHQVRLNNQTLARKEKIYLKRWFSDLFFIRQSDNKITSIMGKNPERLLPFIKDFKLSAGKSATLKSISNNNQRTNFYLIQRSSSTQNQGIYVAKIRQNYIFNAEQLIQNAKSCIVDQKFLPIYCPTSLLQAMLPYFKNKLAPTSSNLFFSQSLGEYKIWNVESISLQPYFNSPAWMFVMAKTSHNIWGGYSFFFYMFTMLLLAAIILGAYLSVRQAKYYMQPLLTLKEGIRDIANQKLDTEIKLKTKDEFEDIADSFNDMSSRVNKHFNAMEMMARIDRMILSTLDIDNIIETVLVRLVQIVPCDTVSVLINNDSSANKTILYYRNDRLSTQINSKEVDLRKNDINMLTENPDSILVENNGFSPSFLAPLKKNHTAFLVLPIFLSDKLSAAIILGYYTKPDYTPEDVMQARDLAHRVAVALSNAAWEDKLYHKAHYDPLTTLPNRLLFHDRLEHALTRAERDKTLVGLMFIDLDRFKFINDSLGHDAGDLFLAETAQRLKNCVRSVDTVSRLGGDEFTIIIPDLVNNDDTAGDIANIAAKVLGALSSAYQVGEQEINSSGSIGIAIYPNDADNYSNLLKNADSAMYFAKAKGKSNYQFYSEDLNAEAKSLLILENQLHHAIEKNEFELYFQPRVELKTGKVVSAEALIRWNHPEQGLVSPEAFIHIAEESGLITSIGEWVFKKSCQQLKQWQQQGYPDLMISLNISAYQFQADNLLSVIKSAIVLSELDPEHLEIEITEGTLMQDLESTLTTLQKLKEMKIRLAIDDFGTGYSSLSYLKKFPLDVIKIDQSFIHNLNTDADNHAIVSAIITLSHSLNLSVIAEGVEAEAELEILRKLNCDEVQGFIYARPLPAREFLNFLNTHPN